MIPSVGSFFFFFQSKIANFFIQNKMTAVGLGQQSSPAVGSGFESLSCRIFYELSPNIFRYPKLVKHWRAPLRNFRHCETKNFQRKVLTPPPPPLIHKLFGYRKFSETQHRRVPLRNFSAVWGKKFWPENRDTPSPPPLIHKFFRYQKFCETEGTPYEVFRSCETKNFRQNHDAPRPLVNENFRFKNFFKHRRSLLRSFSALWDQKFSTEKRDTPLSDASNFSIPEVFRYTEVLNNEIFRYCETKKLRWKNVIPPFSSIKPFETRTFIKKSRISWQKFAALWDIKISTENRGPLSYTWKFSIKKVSGTPKWSPTEYFGTVRQKLFDGKSWYLPPLIHKTFFPTRTFVKHRMVPWRSFFGPVR